MSVLITAALGDPDAAIRAIPSAVGAPLTPRPRRRDPALDRRAILLAVGLFLVAGLMLLSTLFASAAEREVVATLLAPDVGHDEGRAGPLAAPAMDPTRGDRDEHRDRVVPRTGTPEGPDLPQEPILRRPPPSPQVVQRGQPAVTQPPPDTVVARRGTGSQTTENAEVVRRGGGELPGPGATGVVQRGGGGAGDEPTGGGDVVERVGRGSEGRSTTGVVQRGATAPPTDGPAPIPIGSTPRTMEELKRGVVFQGVAGGLSGGQTLTELTETVLSLWPPTDASTRGRWFVRVDGRTLGALNLDTGDVIVVEQEGEALMISVGRKGGGFPSYRRSEDVLRKLIEIIR